MEREAVEEVQREQREEAAEEAGCGVGLGDVTPPVPSGCADQDACYRSIEAAVERFFPGEAAASEGYNQSSIPASSSGVWSGRSLNASVPPSGETSEGAREIDLCGDGVPEPAKDESGHLCEGAKDVSKITNQSSYPKLSDTRSHISSPKPQITRHQISHINMSFRPSMATLRTHNNNLTSQIPNLTHQLSNLKASLQQQQDF